MTDRMHRNIPIVVLAAVLLWSGKASAQEPFFKGKTVRIVVGFAAGGGFDTYSRAMARYWGRHIPGNPSIIVENMAGAGSLIAANHVYKVARPDGLTIGNFGGGLFMQQLKGGAGIEFDARKFEFLGVPVQDNRSCAFTKASGITSMERWMAAKTPVKVGATAPGDLVHDGPKILQAALGLPIHLVSGYKGTADIRLAAEAGELAGGCWGWDSIKATWSRALESGDAIMVVQMVSKPHPDLPKVPLAKPESLALSSVGASGATGPSFLARASAISRACFGTTTAEALMQLRPPLSEMAPAIMSMNSGQRSISSSPMRILL